MKVGIALDAWKRSIFERRIADAGYKVAEWRGVGDVCFMTIEVPSADLPKLHEVVRAANDEAARVHRRDRH